MDVPEGIIFVFIVEAGFDSNTGCIFFIEVEIHLVEIWFLLISVLEVSVLAQHLTNLIVG